MAGNAPNTKVVKSATQKAKNKTHYLDKASSVRDAQPAAVRQQGAAPGSQVELQIAATSPAREPIAAQTHAFYHRL